IIHGFMPIINGLDRHQITFSSLEAAIATDNDVRFIDAFVEKLDLQQLGVHSLTSSDKKKEGRSSFSDALFLKLYLYAKKSAEVIVLEGKRGANRYRIGLTNKEGLNVKRFSIGNGISPRRIALLNENRLKRLK